MAKRRSTRRRSKKLSLFNTAKGIAYGAAIVAPGYMFYKEIPNIGQTLQRYAGIGIDGKFSTEHVYQMWTPAAALLVADIVTDKVGVQRRIRNTIDRIL